MLRPLVDASHKPQAGRADDLGLVGSTVDQVRFDACVDAGGFGLIYRGYHEGLGETVAIKCLRIAAIQNTNEEIRVGIGGRFRDETKLLYRLSQGNLDIVRCIGSGTLVAPKTREYTPYMVLEWLDGSTLSADLNDRRRQGVGPRGLTEAIALLESAALALAHAHDQDVVHRDVKPGNLFLAQTREGVRMKVLDFGLAKILSDEGIGIRSSVQTGFGVHFCSPSYGAPEQYSADVGTIGPWTDVYALCLVLLEVLVQKKVRAAGSLAEGLLKALDPATGSPHPRALGLSLPSAVEDVLQRAVAQNPVDRPRDARAFWTALKDATNAPRGGVTTSTPLKGSAGATLLMQGRTVPMPPIRRDVAGTPTVPVGGSTLAMGAFPRRFGPTDPDERAASQPSTPPPPWATPFRTSRMRPRARRAGRS